MKEFLVRRGGYWLLQWWRLGGAAIGIITFGLVTEGLRGERIYLDACFNFLHAPTNPKEPPRD